MGVDRYIEGIEGRGQGKGKNRTLNPKGAAPGEEKIKVKSSTRKNGVWGTRPPPNRANELMVPLVRTAFQNKVAFAS
jgi:hypothetical protein